MEPNKGEKILIVDDEMIINLNLQAILEKNGYAAAFVNSGEKCLEKLQSDDQPDIILMDINLGPGKLSGPETTEKIYRNYDIPVVLHSAYTDKETIDQTKTMTKYGYIHKVPGNEHFLLATVEMALKLFRSEKELKRNEQKYRHLFTNANDALFLNILFEDGTLSSFTEVNDAACERLGYTRPELLSLGMEDITNKNSGFDEKTMTEALRRKGQYTFEAVHVSKEGEQIPVDVKANLSVIEGRKTVFSTVRDITERRRTQEELQESEERFRQLAENIHETFWLSSPSMDRFYYIGPAFKSTWGIDETELYSSPERLFDSIHEEDRETFRGTITARRPDETGPLLFPEVRIIRPDGGRRWISARAFPVKDNRGDVYRLAGIAEDITVRKRMEEALNHAYSDLNEIFNVSVPLCVISSAYDLLRVNDSFCSYFGVMREEIIGRKCYKVIGGPACLTEKCELTCILGGEPQASNMFEVWNKDGRTIDTLVTAVPYRNIDGEIIGLVENFIDITELHRAENKLSESERKYRELSNHLQHVREEQNAYIAREIHDDLGQSLTALKMNLSLLRQDMEQAVLKERAEQFFETIKEMRNIIDGTVKKVREITKELRPSVLDTSCIIEALGWQVDECREYADFSLSFTTNVETLDLEKDTSLAVFRIVQEALTNCLRHSKARNVCVGFFKGDSLCTVSVTDDGRGFSSESGTQHRSFGIIGMQERAASCGGNISICSNSGKGTVVKLTVPLQEEG